MANRPRSDGRRLRAAAAVFAVTASVAVAQTRITPPKNKYTPAQDVEIGQQAAKEVEQQLPRLRNGDIESFVDRIGRRLVQVIPSELEQREFRYSFNVINVREINAFALPGGPMYVNRGMIQAAAVEGEVAGVMAHELSHVILRHGTAGATKQQPFAIGAIAGAIAGAIIGGKVGQVVAQGSQFGLGTYFLRYSREYEKQADLLGVQLMARAGYDPIDLVHMFQTIEKQGGGGGPQFMSDHPNPGNREAYITEEASHVRIEGRAGDSREFARVQDELRDMSPAPTTEEVTRRGKQTPTQRGQPAPVEGNLGTRVAPPSSRYRSYTEGNLFRIDVPDNWREVATSSSVKFVPDGAYGQVQGRTVFTHGVELGVTRNEIHSLQEATQEFIDGLAESNPSLRATGRLQNTNLSGRSGLVAILRNVSEVTGRGETVTVFTTLLRDGNLFYCIAVAPEDEYQTYQRSFQRVTQSIRLTD
ncbi:MAG TPA: M48 family metallopeptidase [Vicinamibacterales bacterium]|nr:M48 family metallopeptidase [Vicinamibacterales bacterium]